MASYSIQTCSPCSHTEPGEAQWPSRADQTQPLPGVEIRRCIQVADKLSCTEPLLQAASLGSTETSPQSCSFGAQPKHPLPSPCYTMVSCVESQPWPLASIPAAQGHTLLSQKTQVLMGEANSGDHGGSLCPSSLALQPRGFLKHSPALSDFKGMFAHKQQLANSVLTDPELTIALKRVSISHERGGGTGAWRQFCVLLWPWPH